MKRRRQTPPQPAYRDALFMESVAARPVRIVTEYIDPLVRMRREGVGDTIVIFGSARIQARGKGLGESPSAAALQSEDAAPSGKRCATLSGGAGDVIPLL